MLHSAHIHLPFHGVTCNIPARH